MEGESAYLFGSVAGQVAESGGELRKNDAVLMQCMQLSKMTQLGESNYLSLTTVSWCKPCTQVVPALRSLSRSPLCQLRGHTLE